MLVCLIRGCKMIYKIKYVFFLVAFLCSYFASPLLMAKEKNHDICTNVDKLKKGTNNYSGNLRTIRFDTPIYDKAEGGEIILKAGFSDIFTLSMAGENRLKVKRNKISGWIDKKDLFCGKKASRTKESKKQKGHLIQKLFVSTGRTFYEGKEDIRNSQNIPTIDAVETPDMGGKKCAGDCRQLSRFSGYYIYAKQRSNECKNPSENQPNSCFYYLIGEKSGLDSNDKFVGWVRSDNSFIWNTSYGLRVSETLPDEDSINWENSTTEERLNKNEIVCGYETLDKLYEGNIDDCIIELTGGWEAFEKPIRMYATGYIKSEKGNAYKVIAPIKGRRIIQGGEGVNDKLKKLLSLKHLDIMFLVDGTKSMTSHMKKVRETVKEITDQIIQDYERGSKKNTDTGEKKVSFGTEYRFAFQVYRDKYAGKKELGDRFLLPRNQSCNTDLKKFKHNQSEFLTKFNTAITTTSNDSGAGDKDHEENLYAGMKIAVNNLRNSCPSNLKILFVIGDTGYDGEHQQNLYGRTPLPHPMKDFRGIDGETQSLIAYFIQPSLLPKTKICRKNDSKNVCSTRYSNYKSAYKLFDLEANKLIEASIKNQKQRITDMQRSLAEDKEKISESSSEAIKDKLTKKEELFKKWNEEASISQYKIDIDRDNIGGYILNSIKKYTHNDTLNQILMDVNAGMSVTASIERLATHDSHKNIGGRFYEVILEKTCKTDSDSCKEGVIEDTREFYIKDDKSVVKDIWMEAKKFGEMRDFFGSIATHFSENSSGSLEVANQKLRSLLQKSLKIRLQYDYELKAGRNPEEKQKSIKELMAFALGIPFDKSSPLFDFSLEDYGNTNVVTACVKNNFLDWVNSYQQILGIIETEKKFPVCGDVYSLEEKYKDLPGEERSIAFYKDIPQYYPPYCGFNADEIQKKIARVSNNCEELKDFYLPEANIKALGFKSTGTMSYFYYFTDTKKSGYKDFVWLPEQFLP